MLTILIGALSTTAATVLLGAGAARLGVLTSVGTREAGALMVGLLEPCLAASTLVKLTLPELIKSAPLLLWAGAHVTLGLLIGRLLLPQSERRGALLLICAFGNAGGLPNAIAPALLRGSASSDATVSEALFYVQMYLFWWRLLVWSIGPALLATAAMPNTHLRKKTDGDAQATQITPITFRQLFPPPACASVGGVLVGLVPPFRALFVEGALLPVMRAAEALGQAGSALALLTLGSALNGTFQHGTGGSGSPTRKEFFTVCAVRLVLVPAVHLLLHACAYPLASNRHGDDWAFHLVLILQPAMPCALSVQASSAADAPTPPAQALLCASVSPPQSPLLQAVCQAAGIDSRPLGLLMAAQYALALLSVSAYFSAASSALHWLVPDAV